MGPLCQPAGCPHFLVNYFSSWWCGVCIDYPDERMMLWLVVVVVNIVTAGVASQASLARHHQSPINFLFVGCSPGCHIRPISIVSSLVTPQPPQPPPPYRLLFSQRHYPADIRFIWTDDWEEIWEWGEWQVTRQCENQSRVIVSVWQQ